MYILFPSLNQGKNYKIFLEVVTPPRPSKLSWNKSNLFTNALLGWGSSQYPILSQSLINADFFLTSEIGPDILVNVLEDCIVFLICATRVLLNFILGKNKGLERYWKHVSFIIFNAGICSRCSEINGLKISKDLSFQKWERQ